jgi:hypothetical protein
MNKICDAVCCFFFQIKYYLQKTITLTVTRLKFYCTTHGHHKEVVECV